MSNIIIDGNFGENLNARSLGRSIAELWDHMLHSTSKRNPIKLKGLQLISNSKEMVVQDIRKMQRSPFRILEDQRLAMSKFQNPYCRNAYMSVADGIDWAMDQNSVLEFDLMPGQTEVTLFFENLEQ